MIRLVSIALLGLPVALPVKTGAQRLSGTLIGTVNQPDGGVVPGVIVRVTSPALLAGERRTESSDRGQWRLPALPPGTYTLTVDVVPGLAPYRKADIRIGGGETVELIVALRLSGGAESITVRPGPELRTRTSGIETRFGSDYIRAVPSRRYSMFSLINSAPGVSPTSPSSGSVNTVSAFGSAVNENAFLIDGTNFTCPCQGVSRAEPIMDVIQELHVQSMGASVEFGNVQGAVFDVVTKQGSNHFAGETAYYAQPSSLTAQPVLLAIRNGTQAASGYERDRYHDLTASLGGPVKRDRLWFFGAYQYFRDYDSQPGADPAFPRRYEQNKVFGKLNWRFTPSLHMMQSFHREGWVNPTPPTLASPFVTTQRVHASVPSMTFAHLTHVASSRTVWEARVGRFLLRQDADPSSGDRTTPHRIDDITGVASGNAPQISTLHLDRVTAKALVHRHQPGWLGTDHEFKAGVQIERGEHRLLQTLPGGVRYADRNGGPFQAISRSPSIAGGVFITPAVFAADTLAVNDGVTVDADLRSITVAQSTRICRWSTPRDARPSISGGQYEQQPRTLADGTILPVFALTNATSDRRFLLTNQDTLFVAYDGLVLALEKRLPAGWQASASYTFSRAHGLQATSGGNAEEPQFSTIARAGYLTFGQDPNDLTYAAGRLPNDRPHVLRATSVVSLWKGVRLAANLQHFSGKPWAATTQERLPQGSRRILLEPRGTRRLSSQSLLDLRASATLPVFGAGTVDLILDVLNVLNDTAEEALVSDNRFAATFGAPRLFIDPRRAMLGVRLNV